MAEIVRLGAGLDMEIASSSLPTQFTDRHAYSQLQLEKKLVKTFTRVSPDAGDLFSTSSDVWL